MLAAALSARSLDQPLRMLGVEIELAPAREVQLAGSAEQQRQELERCTLEHTPHHPERAMAVAWG